MTEIELERLVVRLVGDGSSYQAMMTKAADSSVQTAAVVKSATEQIEGMKKEVEGFGKTFSAAFAVFGVTTNLQSALTSANDLEKNIIRLNAAIAMNGNEVAPMVLRYRQFSETMQQNTLVTRGEIFNLARLAETMGRSGAEAESLVQRSLSFAQATGQSAEAAMTMLGAMDRGNYSLLNRVRILREARGDEEKLAKVNQLIASGWAQQAALANTVGGQMEKLGRAAIIAKQEIGALVADAVAPVVKWLTSAVEWFKSLDPAVRRAAAAAVLITGALLLVGPAISLITTLMGPFGASFTFLRSAGGLIFSLLNPMTYVRLATLAMAGAMVVLQFSMSFLAGGAGLVLSLLNPMNLVRLAILGWSIAVNIFKVALVSTGVGALIVGIGTLIALVIENMGGWEAAWERVKEAGQVAWRAIQFGFQNFSTLAQWTWTAVQIGWHSLTGEIGHFFSVNLPILLDWFGRNWTDVFTDVVNWTGTVFANLMHNIGVTFGSTGAYRNLTDGFESVVRTIPELMARELTQTEVELRQSLERQGGIIGGMWAAFNQAQDAAAIAEARRQAEIEQHKMDELNKINKQGLANLQASASGSAEAIHRMAEMQDSITRRSTATTASRTPTTFETGGPRGGIFANIGNMFSGLGERIVGIWTTIQEGAARLWESAGVFFTTTLPQAAVEFFDRTLPRLAAASWGLIVDLLEQLLPENMRRNPNQNRDARFEDRSTIQWLLGARDRAANFRPGITTEQTNDNQTRTERERAFQQMQREVAAEQIISRATSFFSGIAEVARNSRQETGNTGGPNWFERNFQRANDQGNQPNQGNLQDNTQIVGAIGQVASLLRQILNRPGQVLQPADIDE